MFMTTLFNLFCPLMTNFSMKNSLFFMIIMNLMMVFLLFFMMKNILIMDKIIIDLFPGNTIYSSLLMSMFLSVAIMNLFSLNFASFPGTTVLFFNLSVALSAWLSSVLFLFMNKAPFSTFTPSQAPWYLIAFLTLIELISFMVRPLTLCFRLLANMSAGHILLSLSTKLSHFLWLTGISFGLLELVVCIVQGYVFILLVKVYIEEYQ